MTISVLFYGLVLGVFLLAGGHFLEGASRALGRPGRWVWGLVLGFVALTPVLVSLAPLEPTRRNGFAMTIPLEALYGLAPDRVGVGPAAHGNLVGLISSGEGMLALWLAASALALLVFLASAARLRRAAAGWPRRQVGGRHFLVSPNLGPAVLGSFRPRIVLPAWALDLDREELDMVLLHEEEHLLARDPLLLAAGILFVAVAPWNPALWWGLKRLRLAVEADCDARVLGRGVRRASYGALLIGVASGARRTLSLAPALAEGGGAFLERRLRIMRNNVGRKGLLGAGISVIAAGIFLFLACETPTPPNAAEEATLEAETALDGSAGEYTLQEIGESASEARTGEVRFGEVHPVPTEAGNGEATFQFRAQEGEAGAEVLEGRLVKIRPISGEGAAPLVYLDGVLQEAGIALIREIDPEDIDRIEVVKGAAAEAVFGEGASGGVIQVFRKK